MAGESKRVSTFSELGKTTNEHGTYDFTGVVGQYDAYRPQWSRDFALYSLHKAGIYFADGQWHGITGDKPTVVCVGSGTGADAGEFVKLGCRVFYIDSGYFTTIQDAGKLNEAAMLEKARDNLLAIQQAMIENPPPTGVGEAVILPGTATQMDIYGIKIDVAVAAQALHTFRHTHAKAFLNQKQLKTGKPAEEIAREGLLRLLPQDGRDRFSVWNYNPDPADPMVRDLHDILRKVSESYAASSSPLLKADYFRLGSALPYINGSEITVSDLNEVDVVELKEDNLEDWFTSYSFGKAMQSNTEQFANTLGALKAWHNKYKDGDGVLRLRYVGQVVQGPVRSDALTLDPDVLNTVHQHPVDIVDPLYNEGHKPPRARKILRHDI